MINVACLSALSPKAGMNLMKKDLFLKESKHRAELSA